MSVVEFKQLRKQLTGGMTGVQRHLSLRLGPDDSFVAEISIAKDVIDAKDTYCVQLIRRVWSDTPHYLPRLSSFR